METYRLKGHGLLICLIFLLTTNFLSVSAAAIPDRPQKIYDRALKYLERGNYQKAIENFKKVLKADPDFSGAYTNLWRASRIVSRAKETISILKKDLLLGGSSFNHFKLAKAYWIIGNCVRSLEELKIYQEAKLNESLNPGKEVKKEIVQLQKKCEP